MWTVVYQSCDVLLAAGQNNFTSRINKVLIWSDLNQEFILGFNICTMIWSYERKWEGRGAEASGSSWLFHMFVCECVYSSETESVDLRSTRRDNEENSKLHWCTRSNLLQCFPSSSGLFLQLLLPPVWKLWQLQLSVHHGLSSTFSEVPPNESWLVQVCDRQMIHPITCRASFLEKSLFSSKQFPWMTSHIWHIRLLSTNFAPVNSCFLATAKRKKTSPHADPCFLVLNQT